MPDSDTIIDTARIRTAKTIDLLLRARRINVSELARRMGQPRDKVRHYVSGRTAVDVGQLELIARALEVPAPVLLMEPEAAARWVLDGTWARAVEPGTHRIHRLTRDSTLRDARSGRVLTAPRAA